MYFNGTKCYFLIFCCALSLSLAAKDVKTDVQPQGLQKPLCFVENKGQIADKYNHSRKDIQYKVSTQGMSLYIGNGKLMYEFRKVEGDQKNDLKITGYGMDVTLLGANPHAQVIPSEQREYVENYYTAPVGPQGVTAHTYNRVTYKDIYPNIDWVLYTKDDKLEYDFVVRPGGNVNDIRVKYTGASKLKLGRDGSICAETPLGKVEEKVPYSYETETGKAVASHFVLKNNIISFNVGPHQGALTIDPALNWSSYFGGPGEDVATSIAVNSAGTYAYVGGFTAGAVQTFTGGVYTTFGGGTYDAFIACFKNTGLITAPTGGMGALLWASYYGGTGNDYGSGVAVDNAGSSVYLTGNTNSVSRISTINVFNGGIDGFLAKFNGTSGSLAWGQYFGGSDSDYSNAVIVDGSGNVYITGMTESSSGIASGITSTLSGPKDAFVAMFNSTGAVQWARYFGGTAVDSATGIAVDNTGSIIITGQTNSINGIATTGAFQTSLSGYNDAFIAKFNNLGAQLWGTYYGGPGLEAGNGIACDASNNIAFVGSTTSYTGIASAKAFQPGYAGGPQDAFVAMFNSAGSQLWGTYYGGANPDYGQGVCFDAYGNVIVAGGTFSTNGISSPYAEPQTAIAGDYDAFIAKFNNLGQQLWGAYFGSPLYDFANAVACNMVDNTVHIAGYSSSTGFYPSPTTGSSAGLSTLGAFEISNSSVGLYDAFASGFRIDTFLQINQPFADTIVCAGGTLNVSFTVYPLGVYYLPGNVYSVQMSDASGSFAAPETIGTGTASPVVCTVPNTPGTGYRIRIVTTSPQYVSPDDFYDMTIVGPTLPAPSIATYNPVCLGNTIYLYSSAPYHISGYNWSGPGGYFSSLPDPVRLSATYADSGVYTLITAHNGCPADTTSVDVVVTPFVSGPTPTDTGNIICNGGNLYLYANAGVAGARYYWAGPDGFTSTLQNPVITAATFANSGTYVVVDTVNGCQSDSSSLVVNVLPLLPTSSGITANGSYISGQAGDTVCLGTLVTFTASTVNGGFDPTYQWMSGPTTPITGAVGSSWSSSTLLNGETIFCIVNSSEACPLPRTTASNVITMGVIDSPPSAYITASPSGFVSPGDTVTFSSATYNGGVSPSYQWVLNGVEVPGATNSTFVLPGITSADTVGLIFTSAMACASPATVNSNTIVIYTNSGVQSVGPLSNIAIFPNPSNGSFTLKGSLNGLVSGTISIDIANAIGQSVYHADATVQNNLINQSIDLQNVPVGVYMLRMEQEGNSRTMKFTVER